MKVTIIGAGSVGSTTAYALLTSGRCSEILLIDVNRPKAHGEALDIKQATPLLHNCNIYAGEYQDAVGSDVVVITSGIGRKPGQTRLELAQTNTAIIKSVAKEIIKYAPEAFYIIVANPVDILTYAFMKYTGLPRQKVIGTGTILDTIRLRTRLAEIYDINQKQVHANVFGEHGDSSLVVWSTATIGGIPIADYKDTISNKQVLPPDYTYDEVEEYVHTSGSRIIAQKGCTVYGIATAVVHIIGCLNGGYQSFVTVSSMMQGEYGLNDVCLSTLTLIDSTGIRSVAEQKLSEEELSRLHTSATKMKEIIKTIDF